jgi:undecaprenyl-diphosphatase
LTGLGDTGCAVIGSWPFALATEAFGALGDGLHDAAIAALLLVVGSLARHERLQRTGAAALAAVPAAGLLSVLLKAIFQMPRPDAGAVTFAFPSGHATTAFALAGALGYALPAWSPLVYLVAVLAGVARVYQRVHFLLDVGAGAVLGSATGVLFARRLLGPRPRAGGARIRAAWALAALGALPLLALTFAYERALGAHQLAEPPPDAPAGVVVRFGTDGARPYLGPGWSGDERWTDGLPMTWAEGLEARVALPRLPPVAHRLRLLLYPYVAIGRPACQTVTVAVNGEPAATLWLDRGWRWYEVPVPAGALTGGLADVRFRFARAERPRDHGGSADPRALSVAFAVLQAVPAGAGE